MLAFAAGYRALNAPETSGPLAESGSNVENKVQIKAATLIDVNTASEQTLMMLPNIGPALAARIVEHRVEHGPFGSIDDLDDVRGIGPKTIEALRAHTIVSDD